jgi:hypothetical protein
VVRREKVRDLASKETDICKLDLVGVSVLLQAVHCIEDFSLRVKFKSGERGRARYSMRAQRDQSNYGAMRLVQADATGVFGIAGAVDRKGSFTRAARH